MSTDFSIRPVGAPAATPIVQSASAAANNAVATALPASQTVRNDAPDVSDTISHQAFIDRAAAAIVYQVVDNRTNTVVEQYPDEAILRRRAYFHTLDLTKGTPTRPLATDRRA